MRKYSKPTRRDSRNLGRNLTKHISKVKFPRGNHEHTKDTLGRQCRQRTSCMWERSNEPLAQVVEFGVSNHHQLESPTSSVSTDLIRITIGPPCHQISIEPSPNTLRSEFHSHPASGLCSSKPHTSRRPSFLAQRHGHRSRHCAPTVHGWFLSLDRRCGLRG